MLGTLEELAARVGGRVVGDGSIRIARISAIDEATGDTLTFATTESYFSSALAGAAAAVLVDAGLVRGAARKPLIVVDNARHALAQLLAAVQPARGPFRHPSAVVEPDAHIAGDVYLGACAYIGHRASIGAGSVVSAGVYIGDDVCIGQRVVLYAGCVIGSDGFGWDFVDGRAQRIPQVGNVVLEDDVEIGANTCIDRAQLGSTRIGEGTKIDNLVQVGHNCRIGKHCVIAALTGLAGSTVIGDYVKVAGQAGFGGHLTVGSGATIAGRSGIWGNVADGATVSGNPAQDHRDELRQQVMIRRLPKLFARVEDLERSRSRPTE
jgi:UDP-3-O-[3-hydroxymyristoyl] glucosamine N-acyltransferase